jgi:hypothetical protein
MALKMVQRGQRSRANHVMRGDRQQPLPVARQERDELHFLLGALPGLRFEVPPDRLRLRVEGAAPLALHQVARQRPARGGSQRGVLGQLPATIPTILLALP